MFAAKEKSFLDFETIDRLTSENKDFQQFLDDLMEDIKIGKMKSKYDSVFQDEENAYKYSVEKGILK